MRKFIAATSVALALAFAFALANAEEPTTQGAYGGSTTEDTRMGQTEQPGQAEPGQEARIRECRTDEGTILRQGEAGFEECVKEARKAQQEMEPGMERPGTEHGMEHGGEMDTDSMNTDSRE